MQNLLDNIEKHEKNLEVFYELEVIAFIFVKIYLNWIYNHQRVLYEIILYSIRPFPFVLIN